MTTVRGRFRLTIVILGQVWPSRTKEDCYSVSGIPSREQSDTPLLDIDHIKIGSRRYHPVDCPLVGWVANKAFIDETREVLSSSWVPGVLIPIIIGYLPTSGANSYVINDVTDNHGHIEFTLCWRTATKGSVTIVSMRTEVMQVAFKACIEKTTSRVLSYEDMRIASMERSDDGNVYNILSERLRLSLGV